MLTLKAPAKINWFLHVMGKRADGYHEISSFIQAVSLYDTLRFEESAGLEVVTDSDIPPGENLVLRAALVLKERFSVRKGAKIELFKEIPISAGLGGGSSDAASALLGLNILWGLGLERKELALLGAELGSDIPFFVWGAPSRVCGRGEEVFPVEVGRTCSIVLAKPAFGVKASWAYSHVGLSKLTKKDDKINNIKIFLRALEKGDFKGASASMHNDLETVVSGEHPEVGLLKESLGALGAKASLMSGSGPAVFGVFEDAGGAKEAERALSAVFWSRAVETLA